MGNSQVRKKPSSIGNFENFNPYSEFCGDFACNACMHKTRAFTQDLRSNLGVLAVRDSEIPVATRANVGSSQDPIGVKRGRICVMCDRKFMLYDYYGDFAC